MSLPHHRFVYFFGGVSVEEFAVGNTIRTAMDDPVVPAEYASKRIGDVPVAFLTSWHWCSMLSHNGNHTKLFAAVAGHVSR